MKLYNIASTRKLNCGIPAKRGIVMAEDLLERLYIALFYFCQYEKFVGTVLRVLEGPGAFTNFPVCKELSV